MEQDGVDGAGLRRQVALTVAGSDSGGNAGIQADLRAFQVFGVHGCCVVAALTAQNPFGVRAVQVATAEFVGEQLDAVLDVYAVSALKTGMLATAEMIETVADRLLPHGRLLKVVDPVMVATSGARLLEEAAVGALKARLLPLATVLTPNLPETELLLGRAVGSVREMETAASELADAYGCAVLVKGGHGVGEQAVDVLCDGRELYRLAAPRVVAPLSTHGTGCSLSAAITAALACGESLVEAAVEGKAYVYEAIRTGVWVGEVAAVLGTPGRLPVEAVRLESVARP